MGEGFGFVVDEYRNVDWCHEHAPAGRDYIGTYDEPDGIRNPDDLAEIPEQCGASEVDQPIDRRRCAPLSIPPRRQDLTATVDDQDRNKQKEESAEHQRRA